ncbi:AFR631Cp [Eremothecium gossypii ATCC 10895]|uniref:AFR631Cp n=1 Tax=Eremothecium gossypii (strain ATCC 10895 / CBS 109.51 / FGSC 9923 / NRRL Y-1056) TaxID=284811 RepID=Q752E5_EREGS|nr:AFR631Cp [Eremothecium gossypii ATCC 10895]AAS54002.1 AFR631Cp [Eremothecium gossypii ATCC 10895]AEY98316.1 FAFR631Cp [Eremothecium gossypii FDAG1]
MPTKLEVNVNNIIFESYSVDPATGHPIYAFDSTYLPSAAEINDSTVYEVLLDRLMDNLINRLPSKPFSLVVFSSGFTANGINWVDGIRMYARLPRQNKNYLQKMYIVHESFFIRTVYQVLKNVMNIKFLNGGNSKDTLVHVSNLSELAEHIDITRLRISLNVYLYDYEINDTIKIPDWFKSSKGELSRKEYRQLIFDKIFKRLTLEAPQHPLVFQKPGSYKKINILLDVIERNNYIDLSQWDIYSIASVFLHFIKSKSKPLFPIDLLPLPIDDSFEYTYNTFFAMMAYNGYYDLVAAIFPFLHTLLENTKVTNHTYMTLSKCLTSAMCKEKVSMKSGDRLAVGTRFIRNLLIHFDGIRAKMSKHNGLHRRSKSVSARSLPRHMLPSRAKESAHRRSKTSDEAQLGSPSSRSPSPPPLPKRMPTNLPTPGAIPNSTSTPAKCMPDLPTRGSPRKAAGPGVSSNNVFSDTNTLKTKSSCPSLRTTDASVLSLNDAETDTELSLTKSKSASPSEAAPPMKLRNMSSNISLRLSSSTLWKESPASPDGKSSRTSESRRPSSAKPSADAVITDGLRKDSDPLVLVENIRSLALDKNEKIQTFDLELRRKKLRTHQVAGTTKFSPTSYSDIPSGNKVSRLASLYEQRLQGLKIMSEVKRD